MQGSSRCVQSQCGPRARRAPGRLRRRKNCSVAATQTAAPANQIEMQALDAVLPSVRGPDPSSRLATRPGPAQPLSSAAIARATNKSNEQVRCGIGFDLQIVNAIRFIACCKLTMLPGSLVCPFMSCWCLNKPYGRMSLPAQRVAIILRSNEVPLVI
jgi:hypothetical protein